MIYNFNAEKNAWLIETRGVSFEEIIVVLEARGALDIVEHPNSKKYPYQKMYIIELRNYVYLVPFIENGNEIFLKTAFPSRKAMKDYLINRGYHG